VTFANTLQELSKDTK